MSSDNRAAVEVERSLEVYLQVEMGTKQLREESGAHGSIAIVVRTLCCEFGSEIGGEGSKA